MKNNKYKILVLSDLRDATYTTLKSSISLANIIGADIEFFYVKKATDIVESDNQLSAMRTINGEFTITKNKIEELISTFSDDYGVKITYNFTFGNVKNEINNYLNKSKPDIIVLGKRKSKPFNIGGDGITDFIINVHKGAVMLASDENVLEPNKQLSLGLFNHSEDLCNVAFAKDLITHTKKPLKTFKFVKASDTLINSNKLTDLKTVDYVFEQSSNSLKSLSNYLLKNKINLLCIDKEKFSENSLKSNIKEVINKLNVSLLVSDQQNVVV